MSKIKQNVLQDGKIVVLELSGNYVGGDETDAVFHGEVGKTGLEQKPRRRRDIPAATMIYQSAGTGLIPARARARRGDRCGGGWIRGFRG